MGTAWVQPILAVMAQLLDIKPWRVRFFNCAFKLGLGIFCTISAGSKNIFYNVIVTGLQNRNDEAINHTNF